jgi:hypothetical protein
MNSWLCTLGRSRAQPAGGARADRRGARRSELFEYPDAVRSFAQQGGAAAGAGTRKNLTQ